jgi:hypothetical protein
MRRLFGAGTIVIVSLCFGCNPASSVRPEVMLGPHRGTTIRLPDDKGFVELTNEPEVRGRGGREPTAIVAYFLKPDGVSTMEPAPSDVRLVLAQPGKKGSGETIPLSAEPKSDDPTGAGRFASKLGQHHLVTLRGTLSAKIDGQDVSLPVAGSR